MSKNLYSDNPDIAFHLEKKMDFKHFYSLLTAEEKEIFSSTTYEDYVGNFTSSLAALGEMCGVIADNAIKVEKEGVGFQNGKETFYPAMLSNLKLLHEFNLQSLCIEPEYGGMGAPFLIEMAGGEILNRACPSTAMNMNWYGSIARIIEKYANDSLKNEYIPKIAEGKYSGYMALTEPDAGSDLAALKTYAEKEDDGSYRLYGTKRFITNGTSHIGLVLAKTKKNTYGLNNLSLFLCPRTIQGQDNVKVLKLEDKLGLHGSTTAELAFDGSKSWLLGKENEGFHYMLDLMNESRIGVCFQSIGLMQATWMLAKQYADERQTWGKPISHHELIAEKLLDMEVETKAMRSLGYETAFLCSLKEVLSRRLKTQTIPDGFTRESLEKELVSVSKKLRNWTPLVKYWGAEKAVEHARTCIQIHGGYGYVKEYRAEWWLRESLIYSIYEGTSQIQALMCVKDLLKSVVRNPKRFIEETLSLSVKNFSESDPLKKKLLKIKQAGNAAIISILFKLLKSNAPSVPSLTSPTQIRKAIKNLSTAMVKFDNFQPALLHAERVCEIKCYEALGESLLRDVAIDSSREWIAERFLYKALPRVVALKTLIEQEDRVLNGILEKNSDQKVG